MDHCYHPSAMGSNTYCDASRQHLHDLVWSKPLKTIAARFRILDVSC